MRNFIVYRLSDRLILRSGFCPEESLLIQAGFGERVIEGEITTENYIGPDEKPIYIAPPPPPPPTPEELALAEELERKKIAMRKLFRVLFNHENRIRGLEGRPPATAEQLKTALENL